MLVSPTCLEFAPGIVKAFLFPKPGYVPKVLTNLLRSIVLQAFCPPPFRNRDKEKFNLLCPVRVLDAYVHRAVMWRKSVQLFVCSGSSKKGYPSSLLASGYSRLSPLPMRPLVSLQLWLAGLPPSHS